MKGSVQPVLLSGGGGTRLWPLSRAAYPKQFVDLIGDKSLFAQTCERLSLPLFDAPVILGNNEHRFIIAEQLREEGVKAKAIVLEPAARNTAPAAAVAALLAARENPDRILLLLPCDHVIEDGNAFARDVEAEVANAAVGRIITFGVKPDRPETGYGYLDTKRADGGLDVVRFVEKPDAATAQQFFDDDRFYWNAGIFMFSARTLIEAFEAHAPAILDCCKAALAGADEDLDFLRLDEAAFSRCENISLDYAIMEKVANIACRPLGARWSDLGAWQAVWDISDKDEHGNAARGDVLLLDTRNSLAHSMDGACLALLGMDDVVAVATGDAVLVASRDKAQDVRALVDQLQKEGRSETAFHKRVHRPWGWFESLSLGKRFQVKCLMVKPGARLSLQSHQHRAEHWVVVSGIAEVTIDDKVLQLHENQSSYIPIGARHRLCNPGTEPTLLIEVQSGTYFGEDDIVRYEDQYHRRAGE